MEIGLIACSKSKKASPAKPENLYTSQLFRKVKDYCLEHHDGYYILSAKYHLLRPDGPQIEPYDETLNSATKQEKKEWSQEVFNQMEEAGILDTSTKIVIHAGKDYYEFLLPHLEEKVDVTIPTKGLPIGKKLQWYNENL